MNVKLIELLNVKLVESPAEADDRPIVEDLLGDIEETDGSRFEQYKRTFDLFVLAPARIAWNDWRARFGFSVVLFFVFMAAIWAPMYPPSYRGSAPKLIRPFDWSYTQEVFGITVWQYPLGTNQVGQPILQRIVNASPAMAEFVLAGSVISIGLAVIIGATAGYKGGFIDDLLMGLTDIVLTIPGLPLVVLLASIFTPKDPFLIGMILAIDNWPGLARSLRSQILTLRQESYVEASRAMGVSTSGILSKDIVPQLMPYILVNAATAGKAVITEAVALYFLGFLPVSAANWGKMMDAAYQYGAVTNLDLFYMILWPMLMLALLSFGLVLLAQGLDQVFNPRLRARHAQRAGHSGGEDGEQALDPRNV